MSELRAMLLSGRWGPGERLPNVRELGAELQVGESTVRRALLALAAEDLPLIHILPRYGTFRSNHKLPD